MKKKMIVCDSCGAINRTEIGKDALPYCGKCQKRLKHTPRVITINNTKLQKLIKHAQLPVLVDVYADWCGPCKSYAPIFEEFSKKMWQKADFYKVNSEQDPSLSRLYNIRGVPTTLVFFEGALVKNQSGLLNNQQLSLLLSPYLN